MSTFIAQSLANLQPDYQQLSAYLLFDQINIQRAIANGTSLDRITTSGADPTAHFTPKYLDTWINALWLASLTLSLATALFAMLADEWYCHYLSPVTGDPQVRSRTRHLRYKGLLDWHVSSLIGLLPLMLHLSLFLFFVGLFLSLLPQQLGIALMIGTMSLATCIVYVVTNMLPLIYPECPYKTPLSSTACVFIVWIHRHPPSALVRAMSLVALKKRTCAVIRWMRQQSPPRFLLEILRKGVRTITFSYRRWIVLSYLEFPVAINTLEGFEIHAAEISPVKHDLDALLWLYVRSSTSVIRHLVIHALAGLPLDYIGHAKDVFSPHWVEICNEKERMLMDCMELTHDGSTRWIPQDTPNIERRIEPLLRLDIMFPELHRKYSSGIFGEHNLDFSMKDFSNTLSTTLSCHSRLHDSRIQIPASLSSQKKVAMNALADNRLHHPAVWRELYNWACDQGLFYSSRIDRFCLSSFNPDFTSEMFLSLIRSIYSSKRNCSTLLGCTLAESAVFDEIGTIVHIPLSLLEEYDLNPLENYERRLLFAILRFSLHDMDAPQSTFHLHQPHFVHDEHFKRQLLRIAVHALHRVIHPPASSPWMFDPEVFKAISSYIASDLFPYWDFPEYPDHSEDGCSVVHALVCLASLMQQEPHFNEHLPPEEWATRSLFSNILKILQFSEGGKSQIVLSPWSAIEFSPFLRNHCHDTELLVIYIFGQALSKGLLQVFEAFREKSSLSYIADREYLHHKAIEGLKGYITGLSEATKKTGSQIVDPETFPGWHIEDLHRAVVIRCITASIICSDTPPHLILSNLASIAPNHPEWSNILETLNSPEDDLSIEKYNFHWQPSSDDKECLKKQMKHVVEILAECLEVERLRKNGINQVRERYKRFNLPSTKYFHSRRRVSTLRLGRKLDLDPDGQIG